MTLFYQLSTKFFDHQSFSKILLSFLEKWTVFFFQTLWEFAWHFAVSNN